MKPRTETRAADEKCGGSICWFGRSRVISQVAQDLNGKAPIRAEPAWALGSLWREVAFMGPVAGKAREPVRKSPKIDWQAGKSRQDHGTGPI